MDFRHMRRSTIGRKPLARPVFEPLGRARIKYGRAAQAVACSSVSIDENEQGECLSRHQTEGRRTKLPKPREMMFRLAKSRACARGSRKVLALSQPPSFPAFEAHP